MDDVVNDVLCIVTGCLRSTPTNHLPILSGIQPMSFAAWEATLSLARRGTLDPDHILHGQLAGLLDFPQKRLKSRRTFVAARKLLNNLSKLGVRVAQWTNYGWSAEYFKRTSVLHVFIPKASSRPLGLGLPRTPWVKLNRLRTGVGRFYLSMYKRGLASSPTCECGELRMPLHTKKNIHFFMWRKSQCWRSYFFALRHKEKKLMRITTDEKCCFCYA